MHSSIQCFTFVFLNLIDYLPLILLLVFMASFAFEVLRLWSSTRELFELKNITFLAMASAGF